VTIAEASRVALTGTKFDVITTYGRFLYLIKFVAGAVFQPTASKPERRTIDPLAERDFFPPDSVPGGRLPRTPTLPKKAVILKPGTNSGRARNAFDEEV
jgi:hypothetical protein